jgi:hypothetical protein
MQFSATSYRFCLFGPNILFSVLFSKSLSLCSSLNVRDQFSHPYKTTGKFIVLHFPVFIFLDSRREDKRFWTELYQALSEFNLLLISSWIRFWFVTVVPKYLNCSTFSKDLLSIFMSWICPAVIIIILLLFPNWLSSLLYNYPAQGATITNRNVVEFEVSSWWLWRVPSS